jgi:diguanylate cyclase (GGDEF)-like protein/PAS domain S-box-containing protein
VLDRGGVVERDAEGQPLRMVGVQTDISRQKAAEEELERANLRLRMALAASGTGIWNHHIDDNRSFWDSRTRALFGVEDSTGPVADNLWHTFLHPEDRERAEAAHLVPIGSNEISSCRYRIIRRDGEVRYVESLVRHVAEPTGSGQFLGTIRDVTDEELRARDLAHAARHDPLTGLLNRTAFDETLAQMRDDAASLPLAVFYIDLDYFKALNDFAGHAAGDLALRRISGGIGARLPERARAARLGGDEFALWLPGATPAMAQARCGSLGVPGPLVGFPEAGEAAVAASIGLAEVALGETEEVLLARADAAMYSRKRERRAA